jgi:hypothetical protein
MQVPSEDWSFDWLPFNMDRSVGRVKMRPLTQEAVKQLDRGRANRVLERHPKLSVSRALGFIKAVKRHRYGMNPVVQDALLTCWHQRGVEDALNEGGDFTGWLKQHVKGLRPEQRTAVKELLPKVMRAMTRTRSQHHTMQRRRRKDAKPSS